MARLHAQARPIYTFAPGVRGPSAIIWAAVVVGVFAGSLSAQVQRFDRAGDTVLRRTDPGADGPVDPANHRLPDILHYTIGTWVPIDPALEPFAGEWSQTGDFFRLDVAFAGLINPPGPLGVGYPFDPFRYGPHPLFGYIEFDMDADPQTGGEFAETHRRYGGTIARFGGMPKGNKHRIAVDGQNLEDAYRSGEDFHIAFHGWQITGIDPADDPTFDAGETWDVMGRLFHRSHAYERFSYACCEGPLGSYEPIVRVRFQHFIEDDVTLVSLVYPLTQVGAAQMTGGIPGFLDGDASNQNSVEEALDDLVYSMLYATPGWLENTDWAVISGWGDKIATDHLNPAAWRLTLTVATTYVVHEPTYFVWTDMSPDVMTGDVDGNARVDDEDLISLNLYLAANDGKEEIDADGIANGEIVISDFGANFSLYDIDYDGRINAVDRLIIDTHRVAPADFDQDGDVDGVDFAQLQRCIGEPTDGQWRPECVVCDLNDDGSADVLDVLIFEACASGPGLPADVNCPQIP